MTDLLPIDTQVLQDLDVNQLATAFPTMTDAGRDCLSKRLKAPIRDTDELGHRVTEIRQIKACLKRAETRTQITEALQRLKAAEEDVRSVATASNDERYKEYYSQLLWNPTSALARINEFGWLTECIVFFRTIFLPGMSLLMPLAILITPILLFKYVLKRSFSLQEYWQMIRTAMRKAMPSVLGQPRYAGKGGIMEAGEQIVHIIVSIGIFLASIWNQIRAAMTLRGVVADMRRRAAAVRTMHETVRSIAAALSITVDLPPTPPLSDLGLFGCLWNTPAHVTAILDAAGHIDMLVAVASLKRVTYPTWGSDLRFVDLYHPGTGAKRVMNTIQMGGNARSHVLLTGPNRGGKSTLLKSVGAAVLMAHTVGIVFARRAILPRFERIITALNPSDVLGKMSLFEAEIEFAKRVRDSVVQTSGPVFLMMDEIFHGTNAHDGMEASKIFLDDLYNSSQSRVFSIISTHYLGLPESYGESRTQNLCMEASQDPTNPEQLLYTYRLCQGINTFSSVREILRERGLLTKTG
jgi:hypothetical protein